MPRPRFKMARKAAATLAAVRTFDRFEPSIHQIRFEMMAFAAKVAATIKI